MSRLIVPKKALIMGSGTLAAASVFQEQLYTGNGGSKFLSGTPGVASDPALVWIKDRLAVADHSLFDTTRGINQKLTTDSTAAQTTLTNGLTNFNNGGLLTLGADPANVVNKSGDSYVAWTFRKSIRFFDMVSYTGNGTGSNIVAHQLSAMPGLILTKATSAVSDWAAAHVGDGTQYRTGFSMNSIALPSTTAANSNFTLSAFDAGAIVGADGVVANANGVAYTAYLFASDPRRHGIIQCGVFSPDSAGNSSVTLGWQPQYVMTKQVVGLTQDWRIFDSQRKGGSPFFFPFSQVLAADTTGSETAPGGGGPINLSPTGFTTQGNSGYWGTSTHCYMAIHN